MPDREFLWAEWEKASRGELTGDCRWDGCGDCGACAEPPGNDLAAPARAGRAVRDAGRRRAADAAAGRHEPRPARRPRGPPDAPAPRRYVARFSVTGRGRFLGHLDRMEAFRRAVRRAGGRLALSAGMRPKPLLSSGPAPGRGGARAGGTVRVRAGGRARRGFRRAAGRRAARAHAAARPGAATSGARRLAARVTAASYRVAFAGRSRQWRGRGHRPRRLPPPWPRARGASPRPTNGWWRRPARTGSATVDVKRYVERIDVQRGPDGEWVARVHRRGHADRARLARNSCSRRWRRPLGWRSPASRDLPDRACPA